MTTWASRRRIHPPPETMSAPFRLAIVLLAAAVLPRAAGAQAVSGIPRSLLEEVMPAADRFEEKRGVPPVIRAYKGDLLLGFVFETEDVPPEQLGYSGPVRAIVGLGVDGLVSGARVLEYYESYKSSMGDFLRRPGIQEQFAGKSIVDPFEVNGDVDGVSRATLSTRAFARGIRNASRRVTEAYADEFIGAVEERPMTLEEMSWFDMRTRGVLKRMLIEDPEGYLDISMTHLPNDSIAEFFLGPEHTPRIYDAAERRALEDPTYLMYALEGPRLRLFVREGWYVEQDGDTLAVPPEQIYSLGLTSGGRVDGEAVMVGVIMLDDRVDLAEPFTMMYAVEGHEGHYLAHFDPLAPRAVVADAAPAGNGAAARDDAAAAPPSAGEEAPPTEAPSGGAAPYVTPDDAGSPSPDARAESDAPAAVSEAPTNASAAPTSRPPAAPSAAPSGPAVPQIDFSVVEEESELARTLATTRWSRVLVLAAVLALALVAFFRKRTGLRYVALAATVLYIGFLDASFLSISHVTAGIWVGPAVYLRDLRLLLMVVVTVGTTLLWGRVFCGALCPFGALQDLIERVVPKRFRVRVPDRLHRSGLKLKYVVLAVVLVPALLGSHASLYQYVEPFGTVFFLSPSVLLWTIAAAFLVASAFVPRFYCRYACPLGAALAVGSLVSLRRIRRVEQCDHCKVCEHDCPTGAIRGPAIDFKECVRCNRCETNLIEKVGVCRHDMEEIRPRLVQLQVRRGREGAHV